MAEPLYWRVEHDRGLERDNAAVTHAAGFGDGPREPTAGELCALARKRSGTTLRDIRAALGISKPTYLASEAAGELRVLSYWRARGFQFEDSRWSPEAAEAQLDVEPLEDVEVVDG